MTPPTCTGIILAGGESKRLNGAVKSNLIVGGKRIIEWMMTIFESVFEHIILVSNQPTSYLDWDAVVVKDVFPQRSSLTGIHSGLFYTQTTHAFITACDIPFLKREIVEVIVRHIDTQTDVVIPKTKAGFEPLCAAYSKRCLVPVQTSLQNHRFKISQFYKNLSVREIPERVLLKSDPELISFFNINTPEDLEAAKRISVQHELGTANSSN